MSTIKHITANQHSGSNHENNIHSEGFGILLKILSGLFLSIMSGLIKYLADSIPLGQLVFFRSAFALIPLVLFLIWTHSFPRGLYTKHPLRHIVRCIFGTLAMFSAFKALTYLPIAEYTALFYLSPIFLVFFAMFFLKESVNIRRWIGVGLGLFGLAVLTVPKFSISLSLNSANPALIGIGLSVLTAILAAAAMLQVRQLAQIGENAGAIAFYFALTSSVMGGLVMINHWTTPELWQWACLIMIGLLGGIAQILLTLSFKYAEASALAPYDYLAIVWAMMIGYVAFAEVPDLIFWIAMPFILMGAMIAKPKKPKQSHKNS